MGSPATPLSRPGAAISPRVRTWLGRHWAWCVLAVVLLLQAVTQLDKSTDLTIDLHVYREAGVSLLNRRAVYAHYTVTHLDVLPFTYPPFGALLAVPLALVPLRVDAIVWDLAVYAVLFWFARLVQPAVRAGLARTVAGTGAGPARRWGRRLVAAVAPASLPLTCLVLIGLHTDAEQIHLGQVGAFLLLLVVADQLTDATGRYRGWLTGVAVALKLTPAVFVVGLLAFRDRRAALRAVAGAVSCTVLAWVVAPHSTAAFFGDAVRNSDRLGPNASTANQSLRGMLLRTALPGPAVTALFGVLVVVVGLLAYRRAAAAWAAGDRLTGLGIVGLLMGLLSPVGWTHHFLFVALLLVALVRDARWWAAVPLTVFWSVNVPEYAGPLLHSDPAHLGVLYQLLGDAVGLVSAVMVLVWPVAGPLPAWRELLAGALPGGRLPRLRTRSATGYGRPVASNQPAGDDAGVPPAAAPGRARDLVRARSRRVPPPAETGRHHHMGAAPDRQPVLAPDAPSARLTSSAPVQLAQRTVGQLTALHADETTAMRRAADAGDYERAALHRDAAAAIEAELARRGD